MQSQSPFSNSTAFSGQTVFSVQAYVVAFGLCVALGCRDSTAPSAIPSDDRTPGPFVAVGVGYNTTCAIDNQGQTYCWGSNFDGQLGTGETVFRITVPHRVVNLPGPAKSLAVGTNRQCILTADGRAYCWGGNDGGQLSTGGAGTASGVSPVAGGLTFSSLAAGSGYTCGITTEGRAYCWGANGYGELGGGDQSCAGMSPCYIPTPVEVAGNLRFVQLSAGRNHTCGVTVDGVGYCWGANGSGQLGNPSVPIQCGPFPEYLRCISTSPTPIGGGLKFVRLAAGAFHTCGVASDGAAYCWGYLVTDPAIGAAALGNSAYTSPRLPQRGSRLPIPVSGGLTFRDITTGNGVTCGLTVDARAVCWGDNNYGQLGRGDIDPISTTSPLMVLMPQTQSAPAIGDDYHACALATSGRIWCWGGLNFFGELGSEPVSEPLVSAILRGEPTPVTLP